MTDGDAVEQVQDLPQHRYDAQLAGELERTWQETWARLGTFHVPNPVGSLAPQDGSAVPADKMFVQDMFPYPSGEGLHVGHPLGYIATDVYARYFRMTGRNVLHALGFDAFGLPAEQYAVQTGTHPRIRTEVKRYASRRSAMFALKNAENLFLAGRRGATDLDRNAWRLKRLRLKFHGTEVEMLVVDLYDVFAPKAAQDPDDRVSRAAAVALVETTKELAE